MSAPALQEGLEETLMKRFVALVALAAQRAAAQPADCPCVTWKKGDCTSIPDPADYINASLGAWVWKGPQNGCSACDGVAGTSTCAYIFPCFAGPPANIFGHHIVLPSSVVRNRPKAPCNAPLAQGGDAQPCEQWWPGKGPKADLFTWGLTQTGSQPNINLGQPISFTQPTGLTYVLARSDQASPYPNCGPGDTGWVQLNKANNTFGCMMYADANIIDSVCGSFEVAYCNHCPKCPVPGAPPPSPPLPVRPPSCPPCPKPPPPPPPAPPGGQPCIRFGHAVASTETVSVTITQGPIVYTWTNYKYSQFSDWVVKFKVGNGVITVVSGGKTILTTTKFLTPGPLVCVIKDAWPPKEDKNVECIAASFVPSKNSSKVRLFNLAMDVKEAALHSGSASGPKLADDVQYTLGSKPWVDVPATQGTFVATDALTNSQLATVSFQAPPGPEAFTTFLLGTKAFGYTLVPEIDAPEFGPCRPMDGVRTGAPDEL